MRTEEPEITTIILDMYGVILEESKGYFIPYTYGHFGKEEWERLGRLFKQEQLFTRAGNGELSSDEFLSMLGFDDPAFHMRNYLSHYLTLDPGFIPFAENYYQKYDFVLLSNDVSEWSAFITEYYQLDKYFSLKIVSGDVKCRKPERKIYELVLERADKNPSECLFVDNSVKNLDVASELGIHSVLFNRDHVEYSGKIVNSFSELAQQIFV